METTIQTIGIAVASLLALVIAFIIVLSLWKNFRRKQRMENQHNNNI